MKKNQFFTSLAIALFMLLLSTVKVQSQKQGWTISNDPFKSNVFVENLGQFNTWAKTPSPAKYVVSNNDLIFFTDKGVTFKLKEVITRSEEENEEIERGEKSMPEPKTYYINMQWDNCNPNATIEVSEQSEGYYTFGEKGYENIKAKGYKKLVYKNLYPGIDAEYIIPEKGGIKYSLIVQPNADLSVVKMSYTGDVEKIKTDNEGNISIKTEAGDITDHTPQSFYKDSRANVTSMFELKDNIVSFQLKAQSSKLEAIVVDPWTTTPFSGNTKALNVDYDDFGNVYISGGDYAAQLSKIAKYPPSGVAPIYVYTCPSGWESSAGYSYGKPTIIRHSGTVVKSEGAVNFMSAPYVRILKLNTAGIMSGPYNTVSPNVQQEMWCMLYNNCTNKLYGFGGGVPSGNNLQILDTSIVSLEVKNVNVFNGKSSNDVVNAVFDDNGDAYIIFASLLAPQGPGTYPDNYLMKSMGPNYNAPELFSVPTGYAFNEAKNLNYIFELSSPTATLSSNLFNCLAVNKNYLFSYDGKTLKAWNKSTGAVLGSIVVDASYLERRRAGIAADECDNVYVGGTTKVHIFNFNGSAFTPENTITANITGEVYDVTLDKSRSILMVCGKGFLTTLNAPASCNKLITKDSVSGTCTNATACVTVISGGTPPYTYNWSTGATTNCIYNVPGDTYLVTITDNSSAIHIDTLKTMAININMTPVQVTCNGRCDGSAVASPSNGIPPYTFTWSNGGTGASITNLCEGTYTISITDSTGCTGTNSTIITASIPNIIVTAGTICNGNCANISATGGATYTWNTSPEQYGSAINVCPTTATNYLVTGTDATGCTNTSSAIVTVYTNPTVVLNGGTITQGQSITLCASGAGTYTWDTSQTGSCITVSPTVNTTYSVTGTDANGCIGTCSNVVTITVGVKEIVGNDIGLNIYPNPTYRFIIIEKNNNKPDKYILTLKNIQGREVLSEKIIFTNTYKLDLTNVANGMYFLTLQNDKGHYVNKVVVQK
ncbi:MAG: T9SS type A sorting domain-containing protein [Bacteroidales bacterium]|jgi:hypothetical protein